MEKIVLLGVLMSAILLLAEFSPAIWRQRAP
jgi:hypothetical protein